MRAWFIDALDATGGFAFAAFRSADLGQDSPDLSVPGVFLSAPDFLPTPVTSRATGMAAARGRFQSGVFLDGAEVGFAALDDLVSFVRRVYLGRGGGPDAPPEEGGRGPFGPPAGEPELGGPAGDPDAETTKSLMDFGRDFRDAARRAGHGDESSGRAAAPDIGRDPDAFVVSSLAAPPFSATSRDPTTGLADAIGSIAMELVARGPSDLTGKNVREWRSALARLGYAARRLGVTDHVLDARSLAEDMASVTSDEVAERLGATSRSPELEDFYRSLFRWGWPGETEDVGNRFDDLRAWPLPAFARWAPDPARATAFDLLHRVLSDPRVLFELGWTEARVLVFSAAHLQPMTTGHIPWRPDPDDLVDAVDRGLAWLGSQFPARAFPTPIEDLIPANRRER
ncbi:hypothetical protein ACFQ0P_02510 [Microbacterium insulae]|uniref:Uncharacterized protein n=1 Tax=Microbacterium insulae TaxID=483014 RepID=A0ABW3AEX9_9MICO